MDCRPNVRQRREIVSFDRPGHVRHAARGPLRGVRRRSFEGAGDHLHDEIVGRFAGHPGRGSSDNPSSRRTESVRATCRRCCSTRPGAGDRPVGSPSARPARSATAAPAAARFRAARPCCNVQRSSSVNNNGLWWRLLGMARRVPARPAKYKTFLIHDTRRSERATQEGGGMGGPRADAVRDPLVADTEAIGSVP